jgi:hypothetical protein
MPLKLAHLVMQIKEHSYDVGRIEVSLRVILIKLLLTKIDTRLKVGHGRVSRFQLGALKVRKDEVHASKDLVEASIARLYPHRSVVNRPQ